MTKDAAMMGPVAVAMRDMLFDSGRERGRGEGYERGLKEAKRRKEASLAQVVGAGSKGTRRTPRTGTDRRKKESKT